MSTINRLTVFTITGWILVSSAEGQLHSPPPPSLVLLKSHNTSLEINSLIPSYTCISDDGKSVAMTSNNRLGVWNTLSGDQTHVYPDSSHEDQLFSRVHFAYGSDFIISYSYAAKFSFGTFSRTLHPTGTQARVWLAKNGMQGEISRIVSEAPLSIIGVPSSGNEVIALRPCGILERFPVDRTPRIRTQSNLTISPDPTFDIQKASTNSLAPTLSHDGNVLISAASEKDKSTGYLYYIIDKHSCRYISGDDILVACGKKLPKPNSAADYINSSTLSMDGKTIFQTFARDSDKIFALDADTITLKRTIHLTNGCEIIRLRTDPKGRIAAQLKDNKVSVIDCQGNFILRDRSSAGRRTIMTFQIVDDTLLLLIGGDKTGGEFPHENEGNPRPFFVERIPLKPLLEE